MFMEVVVVQSEVFQSLSAKIDKIQSILQKSSLSERRKDWITNPEFCQQLGISKRTAQRYRDLKLISFSQIDSKIYYKSIDVEAFLQKHHIKSLS